VKISAVLITFNEEANISSALQSLAGIADEIIVVDSFSTDRTVKLARACTDRVVERKCRRSGVPSLDPLARRG
jgi:glycosyltransferase involved in cell wall biosynthesis